MRGIVASSRRTRGFAPAELLVAALVVLIVFIAASPFYRAARTEAARLRCVAARRLIADAEEQYRQQSPDQLYTGDLRELSQYLPTLPRCPDGGHFYVRVAEGYPSTGSDSLKYKKGRLVVLCTTEGHAAYFAPERGR